MTTMRSARASASAWSWVTKIIVTPVSLWTRCSSVRISRRRRASRLDRGSSSRRTFGSMTMDRARATRCCWPPESSPGLRDAKEDRPTVFSPDWTRSSRSFPRIPFSRGPKAMFSKTVRCGKGLEPRVPEPGFCKRRLAHPWVQGSSPCRTAGAGMRHLAPAWWRVSHAFSGLGLDFLDDRALAPD